LGTHFHRAAARDGSGATRAEEGAESAAEQLRDSVATGGPVALFLDYDGTLREIEREPRAAKPTDEIRELLARLNEREEIELFIVSGRSHQDLESFFPAADFGCVAEHGAAIRRAGQSDWEQWDRDVSYAWKDEIRDLLKLYEQSTPGSWVEEKRTSLVWHHRKTDPEFGTWKAHQLTHELGTMMANEPVKIRQGRKIVEVTSSEVSKGVAIRRLLHERDYAAVLCAGDDQTDESMFDLDAANFISIKIGTEPSRARFRLRDPAAFRAFLGELFAHAPVRELAGASSS
jgi:trehalose 6-phosphate synthase/phosphatase